jgi:hypothetical protein
MILIVKIENVGKGFDGETIIEINFKEEEKLKNLNNKTFPKLFGNFKLTQDGIIWKLTRNSAFESYLRAEGFHEVCEFLKQVFNAITKPKEIKEKIKEISEIYKFPIEIIGSVHYIKIYYNEFVKVSYNFLAKIGSKIEVIYYEESHSFIKGKFKSNLGEIMVNNKSLKEYLHNIWKEIRI